MQKTAVSTSAKGKSMKYFKYEMKETNQLVKDFFSSNISETLSRSAQNKEQNHIHDMFKESICLRKIENTVPHDYIRKVSQRKFNESQEILKQGAKDELKLQDDLQNDQNQFFRDLINDSSLTGKRKKVEPDSMEDLILQRYFYDVSQNQENEDGLKPSIQKYKNRDLETNGNDRYDEYKQIKKQKKGLANISLRVKNIVAQHKKLTYKQVSDYVLQYSKDEIDQLQQSQRIKQVKNIKRRVYDALNVLVAVGILGKHQRCVCITEWTDIPGKRHSTEWQKINSKIQHLTKLKKNCVDKSQALKLLLQKYNSIAALRNKHLKQEKPQNTIKEGKKTVIVKKQDESCKLDAKLMFPVIVFCPAFGQDPNEKVTLCQSQLTVQLEDGVSDCNQSQNGSYEKYEKVKISGRNITILGDFDCVLQMDLQKYRDYEQQKNLLHQIQQYAQQRVKKRFQHEHYKLQTDDFGQASIQDYFNDQMFQSK